MREAPSSLQPQASTWGELAGTVTQMQSLRWAVRRRTYTTRPKTTELKRHRKLPHEMTTLRKAASESAEDITPLLCVPIHLV